MKKILVLVMTLAMVLNIGCGRSDLQEYNNAMKKTSDLRRYESNVLVTVKNEFDTKGYNDAGIKHLENFEDISLLAKGKIDMDKKRSIAEINAKMGGMGIDFNLYTLDEKHYIEVLAPIISDKKYIEIEGTDLSGNTMYNFDEIEEIVGTGKNITGLTDETLEKIRTKWLEILNDENVFKGEKILVTTEEGEVKAREYTIDIKEEQSTEFINYIIDTIVSGGDIDKAVKESDADIDGEQMESVIDGFRKIIKDAKDLSFSYKAYIDIDGHMVEEKIGIIYENGKVRVKQPLKKMTININTQTTNIGKEQIFDMEEPNGKNTIKFGDLDVGKFLLFR